MKKIEEIIRFLKFINENNKDNYIEVIVFSLFEEIIHIDGVRNRMKRHISKWEEKNQN